MIDAFSNIGKRENNQDAYLTAEVKEGIMYIRAFHHNSLEEYDLDTALANGTILLIIADGMGGLEKGEQASYLTIIQFLDIIEENLDQELKMDEIIWETVTDLSGKVATGASESGSTIVGCMITDGKTYMFNVGDSKCIADFNGEFFRTKDHVYGQELESNIITDYIGMQGEPDVRIEIFDKVPDNVILFSDGLVPSFKKYGDEICRSDISAENLCAESIDMGSTDNTTCIRYSK